MTDHKAAEERARQLEAHVLDLATDAEVWCDVHSLARDYLSLLSEYRKLEDVLESAGGSAWAVSQPDTATRS